MDPEHEPATLQDHRRTLFVVIAVNAVTYWQQAVWINIGDFWFSALWWVMSFLAGVLFGNVLTRFLMFWVKDLLRRRQR